MFSVRKRGQNTKRLQRDVREFSFIDGCAKKGWKRNKGLIVISKFVQIGTFEGSGDRKWLDIALRSFTIRDSID